MNMFKLIQSISLLSLTILTCNSWAMNDLEKISSEERIEAYLSTQRTLEGFRRQLKTCNFSKDNTHIKSLIDKAQKLQAEIDLSLSPEERREMKEKINREKSEEEIKILESMIEANKGALEDVKELEQRGIYTNRLRKETIKRDIEKKQKEIRRLKLEQSNIPPDKSIDACVAFINKTSGNNKRGNNKRGNNKRGNKTSGNNNRGTKKQFTTTDPALETITDTTLNDL